LSLGSLVAGRNYELQSTTNLASASWMTESNFLPATSIVTITNQAGGALQKFYRVVGH
jgi:hypothetical protein